MLLILYLCTIQSIKMLMNDFDNVDGHVAAAAAVKPIYKSAHVFFTEGQFLSTT